MAQNIRSNQNTMLARQNPEIVKADYGYAIEYANHKGQTARVQNLTYLQAVALLEKMQTANRHKTSHTNNSISSPPARTGRVAAG